MQSEMRSSGVPKRDGFRTTTLTAITLCLDHILRIFAQPRRDWNIWNHPTWLTEQFYSEQIQPRLGSVKVKEIAASLGVSATYASYIRSGRRRPHPRHWEKLTRLVNLGANQALGFQQSPEEPMELL